MYKVLGKSAFLILITLLFFSIYTNKVEAAITNKPGDIIVTKSTSAKGLTGHVGIYIDSTTILHTSGRASEPWSRTDTETKWHKKYPYSKVIRPTSSTLGKKAADNAVKYFKGKKIKYSLLSANLKSINTIYCSKIPWYSYYKAGKEFKILSTGGPNTPGRWHTPNVFYPLDYVNPTFVKYNGFVFIDNKW